MSKTIDLQIEKSMTLINALKSKYAEVSEKGIKMDDLEDLKIQLEKFQESSKQTDELREKLSAQVRTTNNILAQIKDKYKDIKEVIRVNYPQYEWIKYGVLDKR